MRMATVRHYIDQRLQSLSTSPAVKTPDLPPPVIRRVPTPIPSGTIPPLPPSLRTPRGDNGRTDFRLPLGHTQSHMDAGHWSALSRVPKRYDVGQPLRERNYSSTPGNSIWLWMYSFIFLFHYFRDLSYFFFLWELNNNNDTIWI